MTTPSDITPDEINQAQRTWCTRLVAISKAYMNRETIGDEEYRRLAREFVDQMYDNWEKEQVFFRPTLALAPHNFRTTREGALAYFIGENDRFPDKGFIKLNWIDARHDNKVEGNEAIQTHGTIGIAMGNVYLTPEVSTDGKDTVVDKIFVFRKYGQNDLRLIVHNSAATNLPPEGD
jgi:hypothetical protein